MTAQGLDEQPIGEVNTTPLIDVMLVLLVMFIITIPLQSHRVPIDLPVDGPPPTAPINERNKLVITADGGLLWNGTPQSFEQLTGILQRVGGMPRQPELQFEPDAHARYEMVDAVLAQIKRANITAMGFVGNERYRDF